MGPGVRGRHSLRAPSWLGQLPRWERAWRGVGRGTAAPGSRLLGRKHIWILQSPLDQRQMRGSLARRLAWPWPRWGQVAPRPPAHPYLQALQRKTNDRLGVVDGVLIPHRVDSPGLSAGPAGGAGDPGQWTCVCKCVRDSPSAVLVITSRFPKKRAGNKHPDSSFIKMEFCCKGKGDSNPSGSGGKAAWSAER